MRDFFENDISRTRATGFGDCISKVIYFSERAVIESDTFRGVRDVQGRLQAEAIVEAISLTPLLLIVRDYNLALPSLAQRHQNPIVPALPYSINLAKACFS